MKKYDVCCIGNPLLDFIVEVDDIFLKKLGLRKGGMHLVEREQANQILATLGKKITVAPGGSASNVAAGVTVLGGNAIFNGCIGYDKNGEKYADLCERQVSSCYFVKKRSAQGCAITFITPDGERTFSTFLGAALELDPSDINKDVIAYSKILHTTGFLLQVENQLDALVKAFRIAKDHNTLVSMDLADSMYLERNREFVKGFVEEHVDIVFANEREAKALYGVPAGEALEELSNICRFAVVTLGEKGSIIAKEGEIFRVDAVETGVVNTNGAGDMYDAGILLGIARKEDLEEAAKKASFAASQVVASETARISSLKQ